MNRRVTVLAVTAMLLLAGCGGSSGETEAPVQPVELTQPATPAAVEITAATPYTRALEQLCIRRLREQEAVGRVRTPAQLTKTLPTTASIDRRFIRDFGDLRPRPALAERQRAGRLLVLYAALTDMQDTALVHLKADNVNGFYQYMDQSVTTRRKAEQLATELGAPACAVRPFGR